MKGPNIEVSFWSTTSLYELKLYFTITFSLSSTKIKTIFFEKIKNTVAIYSIFPVPYILRNNVCIFYSTIGKHGLYTIVTVVQFRSPKLYQYLTSISYDFLI